ncbi:BatA domain-containing protein [Pontibacter lucknowensis]|uniref:N-terminal double-transmembrane domain-containing protein n=2 Tax=Pontibacter TaxID=323449 RepID=A0A1N6Z0G5_9BACT|nr:BatA domain-containing protein [Pontibacter lucknowensis]SIR20287.1 N-terminal double-transmembrane domain-containing protein [Pontibacter lucknowensis]
MAFLYPSFLWALAAIAIPIVLHLIQLRRAKRVEFSNVKFIQVSKDLTASQRNLKELLILAARILFITFLVLAFAQPFLPASETVRPIDSSQVTIALDNSLSMQNLHAEDDLTLLTVAADQAKKVLDIFPSTTAISINTNSNYNRAVTMGTNDAVNELDQLSHSTRPFVSQQVMSASQVAAEHVFLFSDFQKSYFEPSLLSRVDSNRVYHLVPLKAEGTSNVFVDSVYLADEFVRPGTEGTLYVRLYNAGDKAIADCPVKLVIDNVQLATLSIDLPPKQITETAINFIIRGEGSKRAWVEVEDYPVEFDNLYYFVLQPSGRLSITEISGNEASPLQRLYRNEPLFQIQRFSPNNIDYARLNSSDIIILQGVDEIPAALVSTLDTYVKSGGTLAIVPPSTERSSSYVTLMQSLSIPASLNAGSSTKTSLAIPDRDNPFFKTIFADYDPKMQMPASVRKLVWSRSSEDILKYRGGAPYLSRFDRGQGKVYLMAAPLLPEQNELVNHALFVPVMYRLAISSYKQEQQIAYRLQNMAITVPIQKQVGGENIFKLVKDSTVFIPEQQVRGGRLVFNVPPDLDEAGFYELQHQGEVVSSFAFNFDKQESVLDQYSPAELRGFLPEGQRHVHVYDYSDTFSLKSEFEKRFFGVTLWKYCLLLCLIFLMAEIALIRFL